jgi:hypothetical protein
MTGTERTPQEIDGLSHELYERYAKPLEAAHRGQYIAVSEEGRTVLGATRFEAAQKAQEELGPGVFLYKLGERSVGKWR